MAVSSTIIGVTIHAKNRLKKRNSLLKFAFLEVMKKIDNQFVDKYGNEIDDVMNKTIDLYQQDYKNKMKEKLDSIIKETDLQKTVEFWTIIRPFYMFVWGHK